MRKSRVIEPPPLALDLFFVALEPAAIDFGGLTLTRLLV